MTRICRLLVLTLVLLVRRSPAQELGVRAGLPPADSGRIAKAYRLVHEHGDRIWPGLRGTPMPVLLVTDSVEYLVGPAPRWPG